MPSFARSIQLPSKGIFYEGEIPDGKLEVRSMTTQEEKLLATMSSNSPIKVFDKLFSRCTNLPKNFSPTKLLTQDRFSLLLHIRSISYGSFYRIRFNCSSCGSLNPIDIDIDKDILANEHFLADDAVSTTEAHLPVSNVTVEWRYTTGEDELAADKQRSSLRKSGELGQYRLARQLVSINGKEVISFLDAINFVRQLPVMDAIAIRDSINNHAFGLDSVELNLMCNSCGVEQLPMSLPMNDDFFRLVSPGSRSI